MEANIKINTDFLNTDFLDGIKKMFPHKMVEIIIQPADDTEYILSNPAYAKELEERINSYNINQQTIKIAANELL